MIDISGGKVNRISGESIVEDLIAEIGKISGNDRLSGFVKEYNKEFKNPLYPYPYFEDFSEPLILRTMKGPLTLYALALNGQVIIDLAAILEQYTKIYIAELFSAIPARKKLVEDLVEFQFLDKLAKDLVAFEIWDKQDADDIKKLKEARNTLTHKNVDKISNKFNNGKPISITEIDLVMSGQEVLPYIMMTIRLLFKLVYRFYSKTDQYLAAQQILEGSQ